MDRSFTAVEWYRRFGGSAAVLVTLFVGACANQHRYVSVKNGCMVDAVVQQAVYRQKANLMPWYWSKILVVNWSNPARQPNTHALCAFVYMDRLCVYDYYNGTREIPLRYRGNALAIANYLYDPYTVRQAWFAEDTPPLRMMAGDPKLSNAAYTAGIYSPPPNLRGTAFRQKASSAPVESHLVQTETRKPAPDKIALSLKAAGKLASNPLPIQKSAGAPPALRAALAEYGDAKIRVSAGTLYLEN